MAHRNLNGTVIMILFMLVGCAMSKDSKQGFYKDRYGQAVKAEMRDWSRILQKSPSLDYHWQSPIVQEVAVPEHVRNGVFIPSHKEMVIIKPGEWVKSNELPPKIQKENYEQALQTIQADISDLTVIPGKFFSGDD